MTKAPFWGYNGAYKNKGRIFMMKKTLQYILWLVLAPLSLWAGYLLAGDRGTAFAVGALVVLSLLPFFLRFEKAKHSAAEITVLAALVAFAAVSRMAFFALPGGKAHHRRGGIGGGLLRERGRVCHRLSFRLTIRSRLRHRGIHPFSNAELGVLRTACGTACPAVEAACPAVDLRRCFGDLVLPGDGSVGGFDRRGRIFPLPLCRGDGDLPALYPFVRFDEHFVFGPYEEARYPHFRPFATKIRYLSSRTRTMIFCP